MLNSKKLYKEKQDLRGKLKESDFGQFQQYIAGGR